MNDINYNNEEEKILKKNKDFRNIALTVLGVFIVIAIVSGGTFAYYTFTTTNTTTINGTSWSNGSTSVSAGTLTVKLESSSATGKMIPQSYAGIKSAIRGKPSTSSGIGTRCVDTNNNTVCKIYSIKLTSFTLSMSYKINLKFVFSSGVYTNLKWMVLPAASLSATDNTSLTIGAMMSATNSDQPVGTGTIVMSSGTATYYIVVWINETTSVQNSIDYGSFTGTVSVVDSASGETHLTSTFTS